MVDVPSPILITGCGRSGASMIAGVVNICGAFGGTMTEPDRTKNGKGLYENDRIHSHVVDYLESISADKLGQFPLPNVEHMPIPASWTSTVLETIRLDGYKGGPWMYKSSKACLMWPVWHYAFPNAKWVIVRRRTGDIVKSCLSTAFMRAFNDPSIRKMVGVNTTAEGWLWWVRCHEARFVEMLTEGLNCRVIWPHRMVDGDYQQLYETIDWLGLSWKSEVLAFIDPKFYKARSKGRIEWELKEKEVKDGSQGNL